MIQWRFASEVPRSRWRGELDWQTTPMVADESCVGSDLLSGLLGTEKQSRGEYSVQCVRYVRAGMVRSILTIVSRHRS